MLKWAKKANRYETRVNIQFTIYWDGKLRKATIGSDSIHIKYDPRGNRIWRQSDIDSTITTRKYIVDISGKLSTILCEIDTIGSLKKSYIYTDRSRNIAQELGWYISKELD